MRPSILILTYNSERSLPATLAAARQVSNDIHIVDSFSQDSTVQIANTAGVNVVQHVFENYGAQRNWAMDNLALKYEWQLHLDADECLTPELIESIRRLPESPAEEAFFLARNVRFLGRVLRHGGMSPTWHLRLFRSGAGRCEERQYDQHFYLLCGAGAESTGALPGLVIDDISMTLSEWTARHNRWSDAEVAELLQARPGATESHRIPGRASGNPIERKRYQRGIYERWPLFFRAFALFIYRFVLRGGFLDGREGFIFWVLQTFWFRFLVDAKLYEARLQDREGNTPL